VIRTKRAYDEPAPDDGERYLVDRLWPRGVSRDEARLTDWLKELAPSDPLRRWFGHRPERWGKFRQRYRAELRAAPKERAMRRLAERAGQGPVTLVYAARDRERNNAVALRDFIAAMGAHA
jgi:uncharacterized protein YeaO (DUF488 family)